MNERIKELQFQAAAQTPPLLVASEWQQEFTKKFAELIVAECMSMCDERRAVYFGHRMASDDFINKNMYAEGETACDAIRYKIKQHFGVTE
jgi:hypothetical protein